MPPSRPRIPLPLVLLALAALLGAYLLSEQFHAARPAPPPRGPSLLDDGRARVYFTTPALVYPDVPTRRPDSPLLAAVLADLDAARRSVDLAVFDLDLEEIGAALLRAHERGVVVRLVLDSHNLEAPEMAALAGRLQQAGVPLRFDRRAPFMHHKFIVVDRALVWAGSWNMTANDTYRNHNNMLRLASAPLAERYTAEFEAMFAGWFGAGKGGAPAQGGTGPIAVFFSPEGGAEAEVLRQVAGARRSIRVLAFSFTSEPIAAALVARARQGVDVRAVLERQNAAGRGAMLGVVRAGGVAALEDGGCYLLHHKAIVVDERVVITGSYNFTAGAEHSNDENMLVVRDVGVARAYLEEFERLAALAQAPMRCG
ncbi:MAG TPA: phospholipase D-like domain-containing protein [Roseiflexaceae bacterium]|nr:phospholipase D-like domain-containing protein [Roseiflexaceae bacterium]